MGLEAVVGEIRDKGEREVERIRKETKDEVIRILLSAQERAEKIKMAAEDEVIRQVRHLQSQEVSAANLVVKRKLLNTEKDLLDQVYRKTLGSIGQLTGGLPQGCIKKTACSGEIGGAGRYCTL